MTPAVHGYGHVNPEFFHLMTVYCAEDGPFHTKYGRTIIGTFCKPNDEVLAPVWREIQPQSGRVRRNRKTFDDALTAEEKHAIEYGTYDGPPSPFSSQEQPGYRAPAITYLRADRPAPERSQHHVAEALTTGMRTNSRGTFPASREDLEGRAKFDKGCSCGLPPVRLRGEVVWGVFDRLVDADMNEISLTGLRHAAKRARGLGT